MAALTHEGGLQRVAGEYPEGIAQLSKDKKDNFQPTTFKQLYVEVKTFACGLLDIGIARGDHVGLISENGKAWLISNLAILTLGAADVPRGCDTLSQEIAYILGFADCVTTIVQDRIQLDKVLSVKNKLPSLKRIIVIDEAFKKATVKVSNLELLTFSNVMAKGKSFEEKNLEKIEGEIAKGKKEDLASIIFTSGTTGEPKGVMLTHGNFTYQLNCIPERITVRPNDIWLAVLPVWHSLERLIQYIAIATASTLAYSRPIGKILLADFQAVRPQWMVGVPRLWDLIMSSAFRKANQALGVKKALFYFFVGVGKIHAQLGYMIRGLLPQFHKRSRALDFILGIIPFIIIYLLRLLGNLLVFKKIKHLMGGRFIAAISGGGALPPAVDKFFAAAGILLLEGYGLTETAPVTNVRIQSAPVPGTVGPPLPGTECRIVDHEGKILPPGQQGIVHIRGKQVMLGYYKKKKQTAEVISEDGWFNTGDLGMLTHNGELKLTGRVKDTIVLLGGENIEPAPIEDRLRESLHIEQAVVLGQDQKYIAALIVPSQQDAEEFAENSNITYVDWESLVDSLELNELIDTEIENLVNPQSGFRRFELIFRFKLLLSSFEVGKELSHKQEVMRHVVNEMYSKEIEELFGN